MASLITDIEDLMDIAEADFLIVNGEVEFNDLVLLFSSETGEARLGRG